MRIRLVLAFLLALGTLGLAGCALYPRTDGIATAQITGPAEKAASLGAVRRDFGVQRLDPASPTSLSERAVVEIAKTDPQQKLRSITYEMSDGNWLPDEWLIQTPDVWGLASAAVPFLPLDCKNCDRDFQLPVCRRALDCGVGTCRALKSSVIRPYGAARSFCVGHSDVVVDRFYEVMTSAHRTLDITVLQPPPDGRFLAAMRNAVTWLARSRRPVTIRVMIGSHPVGGTDPLAFLQELIRDAAFIPGSRLQLYVGAIRSCNGEASCGALSWNHSKIVVADGRRALVGGHNQWTGDYLAGAPTHDISMEVEGPAAAAASRFAGALWDFVCRQGADDGTNQSVLFAAGQHLMKACLAALPLPDGATGPVKRAGNVRILAVGRLGAGVTQDFADQSLVARDLFLGAARQSIRMVQQDVAFSFSAVPLGDVWPDKDLDDIVDLITKRGGDAYLVLSNLGAAGPVGSYSNGVRLADVAADIMELAKERSGLPDAELVALLCKHLHLAPLRFGPDDAWPDAKPIGVHAKFWMVDDRAFYIGSENLYPVVLQEFGYIVEDKAATATARARYWDNVWQWSQRAAVSGTEAQSCVFAQAKAAPRT